MPAKEIKELRDSGKLEEALIMAQSELEATPDKIWAKRNLAWVHYFLLKKHQGNQDEFFAVLKKVIELKLPENENMFYEQFSWIVGMHNFSITKGEFNQTDKFNAIRSNFLSINELKLAPSKGHSFLLKSFHSAFKEVATDSNFNPDDFVDNSISYLEVFQWCGFDCFIEEDFTSNEINGKKIMSFVEQVIIAYSKALLKGEPKEIDGENKKPQSELRKRAVDILKKNSFLVFLNTIIDDHPEYNYTLYYKSKLLLALNRFDEAKESLIPFVKKKKNDFWVWELLAEAFPDDVSIQIACLCKALTLNTKESFLVKVHQKLANLLIGEELFTEASVEIFNTIQIRNNNKWRISNELSSLVNKEWYNKEVSKRDNTKFYIEQSIFAEEILYNNHEEIEVVIEFVNTNKKMLNFIKDKNIHGFFSYKHLKINPKTGDIFKVRLNKVGEDGFYKVLTIKSSPNSESEAVKTISGSFKLALNRDFGFVHDYFVSPDLINKYKLKDGDEVNCNVILAFNKKKKEWGWKVFRINNKN